MLRLRFVLIKISATEDLLTSHGVISCFVQASLPYLSQRVLIRHEKNRLKSEEPGKLLHVFEGLSFELNFGALCVCLNFWVLLGAG